MNRELIIPQIELRKRGVVPKETNVANPMATQAERERVRDVGGIRREKRGGMRVSFCHWCQYCGLINPPYECDDSFILNCV